MRAQALLLHFHTQPPSFFRVLSAKCPKVVNMFAVSDEPSHIGKELYIETIEEVRGVVVLKNKRCTQSYLSLVIVGVKRPLGRWQCVRNRLLARDRSSTEDVGSFFVEVALLFPPLHSLQTNERRSGSGSQREYAEGVPMTTVEASVGSRQTIGL